MRKRCFLFIALCHTLFVFTAIAKADPAENITLFIAEKTINHQLRSLFLEDHPNVEFVDVAIDWSVTDPIERIQGIEHLDILEITNDEGILKLIQSERVEPLTSPDIVSEHQKYFPQVRKLLEANGMIMGTPIDLKISPWLINYELWEEFQLPDPPNTFAEYIDLVDQWHADFAPKHPGFAIAGDPGWSGTQSTLVLNLIDQYIYEQQKPDELLSFDNGSFIALLERILTVEELVYPEKFAGPLLQGHYDSDFWTIDIMSIENLGKGRKSGWVPAIPPAVVDGASPKIGGELTVLCLLQQSKNKEVAMEYLTFVTNYKDLYQPGLSQMLLSQEYLVANSSEFSSDAIEMWNGFVPYISFYTDALGGHTYAREFEGICALEIGLFRGSYDVGEFIMYLDMDSSYYRLQKH